MIQNKVYILADIREVSAEDYGLYLDPRRTRRYGPLFKRALVTALKAMKESGIEQPDAIINGTALGCVADSEALLRGLAEEGESVSMPTHFMQSTHNTVAALIALYTHNHGYNCTYSQGNVSFECALMDAFLQLKMGHIRTSYVSYNDVITAELQHNMAETGAQLGVSDESRGLILSVENNGRALQELVDVRVWHDSKGDHAEIKTVPICD